MYCHGRLLKGMAKELPACQCSDLSRFPGGPFFRMDAITLCLPTLDDLRRHVHHRLCNKDKLDTSQIPLQQALIHRAGKPCGLFFQVQGPRLLRTYAIWAGPEKRVLFYDSGGQRFAETTLSEAPDVEEVAASLA